LTAVNFIPHAGRNVGSGIQAAVIAALDTLTLALKTRNGVSALSGAEVGPIRM
jgi:hypothetical protein